MDLGIIICDVQISESQFDENIKALIEVINNKIVYN